MRQIAAAALLFFVPFEGMAQQSATKTLPGYTSASSAKELEWEHKFREIPEAKRAHENMKVLAAHPHNVGSKAQRENAEWMVKQYKSWGWDAKIEQFDVLYPTPKSQMVEMVAPTKYKLKLEETPLAEDPYTHETKTQLPGYNIYSADGDVTGPLVYVNYGMKDDYEELERQGISVKGAIVITRYGGGWRGLKPKLAYEHGAVGCIIYSDPADDGYGQGDVLPKGPMRPSTGVQRGSVADTPVYSGDPLTPGEGSVKGVKRLKVEESPTIMKIPVLPVSYGDAEPLLKSLDGKVVPASWRGGLPFAYHFGGGVTKVHMDLKFNWDTKPVLDVVATMKGSESPDQWIIRGNHYDGWVNGADDPISGQSGLLEEARALGELHKKGWSPKRTLIYTAWDGEEPGLLGSTEWAEAHQKELAEHAVLYVNSDESNRGFLGASGSYQVERVINDVAREVTDPETKASVWERQRAARAVRVGRPGAHAAVSDDEIIPIGALGSGSDFQAFVDHLGVTSISLGFGGEDRSGTYHSAYDTPWFIDHFGDKEALYGKALADTAGTLVMRVADADLLPYDFRDLATTIAGYSAEVKGLVKQLQQAAAARQKNIAAGYYKLAADPQQAVKLPQPLQSPPDFDFTALDAAIAKLKTAAAELKAAEDSAGPLDAKRANGINLQLAMAEHKFLNPSGLPRRPWVEHVLYAPGWYTGYGAKTMPGVTEAIEDGRFDEAKEQMVIVVNAVSAVAEHLSGITRELAAK